MSTATSFISQLNSNSTSNTSNTKKSSSSDAKNIMGKDDFLKLLITELKYQDPTNPMDNYEYISQMSTFSSLEQMQNLNSTMNGVANTLNGTLMPSLLLQQSSSMIGKEVSYTSTTTGTDGKTETKELSGVVESVSMKDGNLYYVIDGKNVEASKVTKMAEGSFSTNDQLLIEILNTLDDLLTYFQAKEGGTDAQ